MVRWLGVVAAVEVNFAQRRDSIFTKRKPRSSSRRYARSSAFQGSSLSLEVKVIAKMNWVGASG